MRTARRVLLFARMIAIVSKDRVAVDVVFEEADAFRATTQVPPRTRTIPRWPVLVCAFIATAAATGAFLESPLASHPSVAPYTNTLVSSVTDVFDRALAVAELPQ